VIFLSIAGMTVSREIGVGVSARARAQVKALNADLERRVEQRTAALQSEVAVRKRTEEMRERLAAIVDSSDDAIISKTLDGTISAWNGGAEKIFGYSASEAVGKPMLMLLPPERIGEEADILARMGCGESIQHFETVRVRKDGTSIDVSVTISPIRDGNGAIVGPSQVARDITERKLKEEALRESETNFRMLVNLVPQFVWICTNDGLNIYFNERWLKYTGLTLEESYGTGWNTPFHPAEKQRAWDAWNQATAAGDTYSVESRIRAADGSYRWFLMRGEPLRAATGLVALYPHLASEQLLNFHVDLRLKSLLPIQSWDYLHYAR
jgi:PAS domain S-box-containing protein